MTCMRKTMNSGWKLRGQALFEAVNNDPPPQRIWPCVLQKIINCLNWEANPPKWPLTHSINDSIMLSHFPVSWKVAKVTALPEQERILLSTNGKLFEKFILKMAQRQIERRTLLNWSQFSFHVHHSMILQSVRLMGYVTLNFNNRMSMAAVFLNTEKAFDITWYPGLPLNYLRWNFRPAVFFCNENSVSLEGNIAMPRYVQAWVHKDPSCPPYYTRFT